MTAFSVATTAFAAHAGGGFATGNQENTWFVSLGWPAIVGVAVAMLLLAMTIREGQIMMNSRGLKTYKELFECLFHPFDKVVNIPWWRSHPIHENRATESICTEPCNPLLRATKSTKRATSA